MTYCFSLHSLSVGLMMTLLTACAPAPSHPVSLVTPAAAEIHVISYDAVACEDLWQVNDNAALNQPLYWLRAMACGVRLSPAGARAEAKKWPHNNWQSAFKQSILLDNGNVTPVERRAFMAHLDDFMFEYPAQMRPLIQLWHDQQAAQLQLAEERMRYAQLQQSSDQQLDGLRQRQVVLQQALNQTQRKLKSLTDIERQLSNRRGADASEVHGNNKPDVLPLGQGVTP